MYVAIVESPLQALNAIEYLNSFNTENKGCYFVIFSNPIVSNTNLEQIITVLNLFSYNDRVILNVNGGFKELIKSRNAIKHLVSKLPKIEVKQCVVGEYRSLAAIAFINEIKAEKVIVVDDGNATLRVNRVSSQLTFLDTLKKSFANMLGLNISSCEELTFFSVYDIRRNLSSNDTLVFNDYSFLKSRVSESINSSKQFVIGSPLEAAGVVDDDLSLTLVLIDNIIKNKKVNKTDLVYISHRRESQRKLLAISQYGIKVLSLRYPFELYSLMNNDNAVNINGFYSSLFPNLLNINSEISIYAYKVPLKVIQPKFRGFVEAVYSTYQMMNDSRLHIKKLITHES